MHIYLFDGSVLTVPVGDIDSIAFFDPNIPDVEVESLSIEPSQLTLVLGESSRLEIIYTPAHVEPDITWESSDESVVSVDVRGVVSAVGTGEALVIAKANNLSAVCSVTVLSPEASIQYTGAVIWSVDTTAFANADGTLPDTTIEAGSGEKFNCYKALAQLYVMSEGFFVNESGYLDGIPQGSWISVQTPIWYGTAYLNPSYGGGVQFSLGEYIVAPSFEDETLPAHGAYSGSVNEEYYLAYADLFVQYYNAAILAETEDEYNTNLNTAYTALQYAGLCVENTIVEKFEYHTTAEGYGDDGYYSSYVPAGIITDAYFSLNSNGINNFMMGVNFLEATYVPIDNQNYYWGLNWAVDTTNGTFSWVDQEIHYGKPITYTFGEVPSYEKPGRKAQTLVASPASTFKGTCPMKALMIEHKLGLNKNQYSFLKK